MQQLRRPNEGTKAARAREERRGLGTAFSSIVLHVGFAFLLWQALKLPEALQRLLRTVPQVEGKPQQEKLIAGR